MPTRRIRTFFISFTILLCLPVAKQHASDTPTKKEASKYQVSIQGITDKKLAKHFREAVVFEKKPENRQEFQTTLNDYVEKLTDLAHFYGYYDAKISYKLVGMDQRTALFTVELGARYILEKVTLEPADSESAEALAEGEPPQLAVATSVTFSQIIEYEQDVLLQLKKNGYAQSELVDKTYTADAKAHTLTVKLVIRSGPRIYFGPIHIRVSDAVRTETVEKYITFKEGELYDREKLEDTERALEKTGLFSSVIIAHEKPADDNAMPVTLIMQESKHKSIGFGINYTTTWGPGITAEWENQNLRGTGDALAFRTELWKKWQTATLSLTQKKYKGQDLDLVWLLEYNKIHTIAYDSLSYSASRLVQKQLTPQVEIGWGTRLEWLHAENFAVNQTYHLLKLPLQVKWSNANSLMDPTSGHTLNVKFTPAAQFLEPHFVYGIHLSSFTSYFSTPENFVTLATKVVVGNIVGASHSIIPPPDRFYGGSENILRGYRAFTVSPLHDNRIPIGGRSLLAGSLETRFRMPSGWGWVFFYDVGNIYATNIPKITPNQKQSVGTGIRYATPIGPLRLDIAFPLDRRPHIDPRFQIFFSIGQSF